MDFKEIRKIFSKAITSTGLYGISAIYAYKDRWFAQSICDEQMVALIELLNNSEGLIICNLKGKYARLIFKGAQVTKQTSIHEPLVHEITNDELTKIINNSNVQTENGLAGKLMEFEEVNEESLQMIIDEIKRIKINDIDMQIKFISKDNWKKMLDIVQLLPNSASYSMTYVEPEDGFPGYIEFSLDSDIKSQIAIYGDIKSIIIQLLNISSEIAIEGNIELGIIKITFFI